MTILNLRRTFVYLFFISLVFSSCSKPTSEPVPQTATLFLTHGEDRKWMKIEDQYIETGISIPMPDCMRDDVDVFVVDNTIHREFGNILCNGSDEAILKGSWSFYDDERFLIKNYTQYGITHTDTLQILLLNENSLIVKKIGQDLIKSVYYPRTY